ncbi:DUF1223 domain-containing protein [Loktanella sp. D2R18]|uniref:DUF1223 domain-containing protein n=1 Tax=Rhodobacterales TaxID=204455 RepID=UPI000DE932F5|nr:MULTISPECIES: DUF1223 domain-containing protein [Rhodobacterales]MDO6589764.1 DUF1223 domain-containing protein [Yoonia sp. 1_MG-2023]RBW44387.1 DUF1223 domain-containing protein [Loktanella sp. D2R18]
MFRILSGFAVCGFLFAAPGVGHADPVVVELYTSQGCSSCPPADAILHDLAQRDDVIALALHVDYWDYIGWADSFANPEYTARQHAYARAAHAASVYTPQMIIGGVDHVIGSRPMQVMDLIQAHNQQEYPVSVTLTRSEDYIEISATASQSGDYVFEIVRYTPQASVDIRRGENAGKQLTYSNIVTDFDQVAEWDGAGVMTIRAAAPGDDPVAVLVQRAGYGPIVGAAQLR